MSEISRDKKVQKQQLLQLVISKTFYIEAVMINLLQLFMENQWNFEKYYVSQFQ